MKIKNIFLIISLVAFAVGFNSGDSVYLGAGLPFGAILLGSFMIFTVLEKETALLDEQRRVAGKLLSTNAQPVSPAFEKNAGWGYASAGLKKGITT